VDAVENNNGCITRCKLISSSCARVFRNVMQISRVAPAASEQFHKPNQCVVTPLAVSHGCGLIALYTSPYLTPAG
jgi:hypothetical protein